MKAININDTNAKEVYTFLTVVKGESIPDSKKNQKADMIAHIKAHYNVNDDGYIVETLATDEAEHAEPVDESKPVDEADEAEHAEPVAIDVNNVTTLAQYNNDIIHRDRMRKIKKQRQIANLMEERLK